MFVLINKHEYEVITQNKFAQLFQYILFFFFLVEIYKAVPLFIENFIGHRWYKRCLYLHYRNGMERERDNGMFPNHNYFLFYFQAIYGYFELVVFTREKRGFNSFVTMELFVDSID